MNLLQKARFARDCFPGVSTETQSVPRVQVNHNAKNSSEFIAADEYFTGEGFKPEFVDRLFFDDGSWEYKDHDPAPFGGLNPQQIHERLKCVVNEIYELANGSLDKISDNGFNRHDTAHILKVLEGALVSLRPHLQQISKTYENNPTQAKEEVENVIKQVLLSVWGHDLGNILSRSLHSLISPNLLEAIFPTVFQQADGTEDAALRRTVRRAIMLHNEPVALSTIDSWGRLTLDEQIASMSEKFGPVALATIIGDKIDIGRHRISKKPSNPQAVDSDEHLQVNLYLDTAQLDLSDPTSGEWQIDFTPGMDEQDQKNYKQFSYVKEKDGAPKYEAWVPDEVRRLHREHNLPHSVYAEGLFWKLYWPRVRLTVMSFFALYPERDTFSISIRDKKEGNTFAESKTIFIREKLEGQFTEVEKKYSLGKKATR